MQSVMACIQYSQTTEAEEWETSGKPSTAGCHHQPAQFILWSLSPVGTQAGGCLSCCGSWCSGQAHLTRKKREDAAVPFMFTPVCMCWHFQKMTLFSPWILQILIPPNATQREWISSFVMEYCTKWLWETHRKGTSLASYSLTGDKSLGGADPWAHTWGIQGRRCPQPSKRSWDSLLKLCFQVSYFFSAAMRSLQAGT